MALCLIPSLRIGSFARIARPAARHFHPLMRPSEGHGDSGEGRNPGEAKTVFSFSLWERAGVRVKSPRHQPPTPSQ